MDLATFHLDPDSNQTLSEIENKVKEAIASYHQVDDLEAIFSNSVVNWTASLTYFIGLACCAILGMVSYFERSGMAGPFRCITNQLISFSIDQLVILFAIPCGMSLLRTWYGPLPYHLCAFGHWARDFAGLNGLLLVVSTTGVRFTMICIHKSVRTMDDNFIATFLYMATTLISLVLTGGNMYFRKSVRRGMKICTGQDFTDDYSEEAAILVYVLLVCAACHLLMSLAIAWRQRKSQVQQIYLNPAQQASSTSLTGKLLDFGWVAVFVILIGAALSFIVENELDLSDIVKGQLIFAAISMFCPFLCVVLVAIYFLIKKKKVREFIRSTISSFF